MATSGDVATLVLFRTLASIISPSLDPGRWKEEVVCKMCSRVPSFNSYITASGDADTLVLFRTLDSEMSSSLDTGRWREVVSEVCCRALPPRKREDLLLFCDLVLVIF